MRLTWTRWTSQKKRRLGRPPLTDEQRVQKALAAAPSKRFRQLLEKDKRTAQAREQRKQKLLKDCEAAQAAVRQRLRELGISNSVSDAVTQAVIGYYEGLVRPIRCDRRRASRH